MAHGNSATCATDPFPDRHWWRSDDRPGLRECAAFVANRASLGDHPLFPVDLGSPDPALGAAARGLAPRHRMVLAFGGRSDDPAGPDLGNRGPGLPARRPSHIDQLRAGGLCRWLGLALVC